jgi:hypothetical protein
LQNPAWQNLLRSPGSTPHQMAWRERIATLTPEDNTALAIGQYGHANSRETDVSFGPFATLCAHLPRAFCAAVTGWQRWQLWRESVPRRHSV